MLRGEGVIAAAVVVVVVVVVAAVVTGAAVVSGTAAARAGMTRRLNTVGMRCSPEGMARPRAPGKPMPARERLAQGQQCRERLAQGWQWPG